MLKDDLTKTLTQAIQSITADLGRETNPLQYIILSTRLEDYQNFLATVVNYKDGGQE